MRRGGITSIILTAALAIPLGAAAQGQAQSRAAPLAGDRGDGAIA